MPAAIYNKTGVALLRFARLASKNVRLATPACPQRSRLSLSSATTFRIHNSVQPEDADGGSTTAKEAAMLMLKMEKSRETCKSDEKLGGTHCF